VKKYSNSTKYQGKLEKSINSSIKAS